MKYYRHPQTQSERKADHALDAAEEEASAKVKSRARGQQKGDMALPSDWSDLSIAAKKDRSRGKATHARRKRSHVRSDVAYAHSRSGIYSEIHHRHAKRIEQAVEDDDRPEIVPVNQEETSEESLNHGMNHSTNIEKILLKVKVF